MNVFEIVVLPNNETVYLVNGKVDFYAVSRLSHMIYNNVLSKKGIIENVQNDTIIADERYKDQLIKPNILDNPEFSDDELSSVNWFKNMKYSVISQNINKFNSILSNLKTLEDEADELQEDISEAYQYGTKKDIEILSAKLEQLRDDMNHLNEALYQLTNILI